MSGSTGWPLSLRCTPHNPGLLPRKVHGVPPDAVLARPLSLASYPVATGRPRPGQQLPRARRTGEIRLTACSADGLCCHTISCPNISVQRVAVHSRAGSLSLVRGQGLMCSSRRASFGLLLYSSGSREKRSRGSLFHLKGASERASAFHQEHMEFNPTEGIIWSAPIQPAPCRCDKSNSRDHRPTLS